MPPITSFHGDYEFLSNFAYSPLFYEGESYPTVEHAFQAAKTFDPTERQKVREAPNVWGDELRCGQIGRR